MEDVAAEKASATADNRHNQLVSIDTLLPHARNYRQHPDDEIEHLMESIRANGIYRNIVIAEDGTILAGHGVIEAARRLGFSSIPVFRTDFDSNDPRAIKLLVADNTIGHLAMDDDRLLTELLRDIKDADDINGLFGTGYDDMMLANLVMVSRPASEIADLEAAAQWVGLPTYDEEGEPPAKFSVIVNFTTEEHCKEFCQRIGFDASRITTSKVRPSLFWPEKVRDDLLSIRFTAERKSDAHE